MDEALRKLLREKNPWVRVGDKIVSINVSARGRIVIRVGSERVEVKPETALRLFTAGLMMCEIVIRLNDVIDWKELWSDKMKAKKGKAEKKETKKETKKEEEEGEEEVELA